MYEMIEKLTKKQKQVTQLAVLGYGNAEMADLMGLTESGVKFHLTQVFKKFEVKDKHQLVCVYYRWRFNEFAKQVLAPKGLAAGYSGFFSLEDRMDGFLGG